MPIAANRMTGFRTFVLAFGLATCAAGQPATALPPIPWARMIWSPANVGGKTVEHAALMVEVQLKGVEKPVLMQLDTGCDADLVYDIPFGLLDPGGSRAGRNQVLLGGTVGGRQFEREPFFVRGTAGVSWLSSLLLSAQERIAIWKGKEVLLGTIGAAFLEQRVLLLDFAANRVAILGAGEELPAALAAHVEFTPIAYRDHKIFVGVAVNGSTRLDLAFDTGSSTAALITTRDRWLEWTGRRPEDPSNTVMVAWAWDRYGKWLGAPIQGALCVGGACLASPTAFFESTGLPNCDFDHYPFRIAGLIGNALFEGRFSVIVDVPHRRFGLFAGSLAHAVSR